MSRSLFACLFGRFEKLELALTHTHSQPAEDNTAYARGIELSRQWHVQASTHMQRCEYAEALECFQQELEIQQKFLKFGDNRAFTFNNMGTVFLAQGEENKALEYLHKGLAGFRAKFGDKHLFTARALSVIGDAYVSKGELDAALEHHTQALAIRRGKLGDEHLDTADSLSDTGEICALKKQHDTALEYLHKALAIQQPHKIMSTATTYSRIGAVLSAKGEHDAALEHVNKALVMRRQLLEQHFVEQATTHVHPLFPQVTITTTTTTPSGSDTTQEKDARRAAQLVEEHLTMANTFTQLGAVYTNKGEGNKALECYEKALAVRRVKLGEEHNKTAESYLDVGTSLLSLRVSGDRERAGRCLNKAASVILRKGLAKTHPLALKYAAAVERLKW